MRVTSCALFVLTAFQALAASAQSHEYYAFRARGEQAVSSVLEVAPDIYWIATFDGIARIDLAGDSLFFIKPDDGVQGHGFTDIAMDPKGHLWTTGRNALVRFDGERWYQIPLTRVTDLLVGIDSDSNGNIWVAGGLGKLSPLILKVSELRATHFDVETGLIQDWIAALLVDHLDQVWTATEFGLNLFDGQAWRTVEIAEGGKRLSNITDLWQGGSTQVLAVSTFGEVFQIDPESRTVKEIKPKPSLESLYHVARFDDEIWVGSKQSLARLKHGLWKTIPEFNMAPGEELLDMSFSHDGRLLLGTTAGLIIRDRE